MAVAKIFVVDPQPIARFALKVLLEPEQDLEFCGGGSSLADVSQQLQLQQPDIVIAGVSSGDGAGFDLLAYAKKHLRSSRVLVWSQHDEQSYAERMVRAGAAGFLSKRSDERSIVEAIRCALQGDVYLSSEMTKMLLKRVSAGDTLAKDPVASLTNRELEVFRFLGQGKTVRQIANLLSISGKTVEAHRDKARTKLKFANSAELARAAVEWVLEHD